MITMIRFLFIMTFYSIIAPSFGQRSDFDNYIRNFGKTQLPIVINNTLTCNIIFDQRYDSIFHETYKEISTDYVINFICKGGFCDPDPGYFRYDYGVIINHSSDFTSALIRKQKYEGESALDYDLAEILYIAYDNKGRIISRAALSKDNDIWRSQLNISARKIEITQIKIIDPNLNLDIRKCEIEEKGYLIDSIGNLKEMKSNPLRLGHFYWNKEQESFELKDK